MNTSIEVKSMGGQNMLVQRKHLRFKDNRSVIISPLLFITKEEYRNYDYYTCI